MQDTSNTAPGLSSEIRRNQNDINATPGVGSAAPKPGKAAVAGDSVGSFPGTSSGSAYKEEARREEKEQHQHQQTEKNLDADGNELGPEYPPQRHAGAVGLGPNYKTGPSMNDKMHGLKDKLVGKMTHDEARVERGKERQTGELYENRFHEDQARQDPLTNPVKGHAGLTGPAGQLNPDDSKGMASKRLGEDSSALGTNV